MYDKWNKYKIGQIPWINRRKNHPHRQIFIDFVIQSDIKSIVEVGPGEMLEYQEINRVKPDIDYTIIDVSELFINNCASKFPKVNIIKSSIEDINYKNIPKFDLIYVASVFEHSKNVATAIANALRICKMFHFVMFKWKYDGDLISRYNTKKKFWSTSFNINKILDIIKSNADIGKLDVIAENGDIIKFNDIPAKGEHRDGGYLIIQGTSRIS